MDGNYNLFPNVCKQKGEKNNSRSSCEMAVATKSVWCEKKLRMDMTNNELPVSPLRDSLVKLKPETFPLDLYSLDLD